MAICNARNSDNGATVAYIHPMSQTRIAKKKAVKKAKAKAAESGVSAAQRVFAKVLEKADPNTVHQARRS